MTLAELRAHVETEIDNYVYLCPPNAVGKPMPQQWVDEQLKIMKASLLAPYWAPTEIKGFSSPPWPVRNCAVLADDGQGYRLIYDPEAKQFELASYGPSGMDTIGVAGDPVGCFLAR